MKITIFKSETGQIMRVADVPESMVPYQTTADEGWIYGSYADDCFYIDRNIAVAAPKQTNLNHTFNYLTKQWEDLRTLADVKAVKNSAINQARAAANTSTFTFQGKQIATDYLSRSDIDATHGAILMIQALPPGWPGGWKTADNSYVAIPDVATWGQFYGAMVAQGTANFNRAQALKFQVESANTIDAVEAIKDW